MFRSKPPTSPEFTQDDQRMFRDHDRARYRVEFMLALAKSDGMRLTAEQIEEKATALAILAFPAR